MDAWVRDIVYNDIREVIFAERELLHVYHLLLYIY